MFFAALSVVGLAVAFAVGVYVPARYRLSVWTIVIVGAVVPWLGFQGHPHWDRIGWTPFGSPPLRARDMLANVALYIPLGLWHPRSLVAMRRDFLQAMAWALAVSAATEATQIFSHGRFPSMTDVVMNVVGAALGVFIALAVNRRRT
jgi:glycopeptide antibiotics resistance protein